MANSRQSATAYPGRAIVIGGSLGGLFAATLLHAQGWLVDVYERSPHDLDSRGGGIVLQPEVLEAFRRARVRYDMTIGVEAKQRVFLDRVDGIVHRIPMRQMLTSWTSLYAALRRRFPAEHYHQGTELVSFAQSENAVTARFADGHDEMPEGNETTGDLLIAADGGGSTVRRILLPEVKPDYAGYVAWRGLVEERDLAPEAAAILAECFAFFEYPNSHILGYMVPGENESIEPGQRRFNWVWYRNVAAGRLPEFLTDRNGRIRSTSIPPGLLSAAVRDDLRAAARRFLPPAFRTLVEATHAPFIQAIVDLSVPHMAFGRVALVGDAAFVPRPHTAASTSKAAGNALALADALATTSDVPEALKRWELEQLRIGRHLRQHGQSLGNRSQKAYPADTPT